MSAVSQATEADKNSASVAVFQEFLAPGVVAEDVEALWPLLQAQPVVSAFIALFRGGEEEVLARLLVLREIGTRTENDRLNPDAIRRHFVYLDPVKLETVLSRLRSHQLLRVADEDGCYELSDLGRNAVAAVSMLLRFSGEEDLELGFLTAQLAGMQATGTLTPEALSQLLSKLNELSWHFEDAIASGSEFRIASARGRLQANLQWIERGTDMMKTLLADPDLPFEAARVGQRIGLAQSRLARIDATFQRALNKIEAQRVTLGQSGVSSSNVAAWLRRQSMDTLAALATGSVHLCPNLLFMANGHELLDRAENILSEDPQADTQDISMPPEFAAPQAPTPEHEDLRMLEHFQHRLRALYEDERGEADLGSLLTGGGFAPASYRFSLLALLSDQEETASGPIAEFMRQPLKMDLTGEVIAHGQDDIAALSEGRVFDYRRTPASLPTE